MRPDAISPLRDRMVDDMNAWKLSVGANMGPAGGIFDDGVPQARAISSSCGIPRRRARSVPLKCRTHGATLSPPRRACAHRKSIGTTRRAKTSSSIGENALKSLRELVQPLGVGTEKFSPATYWVQRIPNFPTPIRQHAVVHQRPTAATPATLRRRRLPRRVEQFSCSSQIRRLEALGKAIVDGLKNLDGTGSIFLPDQ
jgi:hypothetical protein